MSSKNDTIVAKTFSHEWSLRSVKKMFEYGNMLRYVAVFVLVYHAVKAAMKNEKQPEVTAFSILQLIDILCRLPLSIHNTKTQYLTVKRFSWIYVILVTIYLVPILGKPASLIVFVIMSVFVAIYFKNTVRVGSDFE